MSDEQERGTRRARIEALALWARYRALLRWIAERRGARS